MSNQCFANALEAARIAPVLQADKYWELVRALHLRCDRAIFEQAARLCTDQDPLIRAVGADVLAQLGCAAKPSPYPFADESAPVLISLLSDFDNRVVASALFALGHLKRGESSELVTTVQHRSPEVRCALAYALGGRSDQIACDALVNLTNDHDLDTRNWATFSLGSLSECESNEVRDALALRLSDTDNEVRGEAMVGLARRQDERALAAILTELGSENVSSFVIEAAGLIPRLQFIPKLEQWLAACPDDQDIQFALEKCRSLKST